MTYDRLSAFDASLLRLERPNTPFHAGGVSIFGPGMSFADVHETLRVRLDEVPLARRRLQSVPLRGGLVWVDDRDFDLSFHLRHAALPSPGGSEQLADFLARLIARPLDRSRPLWELYVIEGLRGGRTALFRKVHLAIAGGDGADPFSVLLDRERDLSGERPVASWRPRPAPSAVELVADHALQRVGQAVRAGQEAGRLAADPRRAASTAANAAGAALGMALRAARVPPRTPLNRPLTGHRRFAMARVKLDDLRLVRSAFGGTINDAVVTVCADAVGRLIRWRGHDTKDLDLRLMVPVRVHQGEAPGTPGATSLGEGAVGVLAPLPVMEMDPVARLYRIMGEMAGIKESKQAVAAERLAALAAYAPANLHAVAARLVTGEQRYHVALSNAPGPQHRLWLADAPLEESYPFIPLAGDAALSIAVSSYAGLLCFGLLGDRRAMPDLDRLAGFVRDAADTLVEAASA